MALPNSLINLLEKEQHVFDVLNLTPPALSNDRRRHSSHYFPNGNDTEPVVLTSKQQQQQQPKPQQQLKPQPLVPPPVPKRAFQNKYRRRDTAMNYSNSSYEQQSATLDSRSYSQYRSEKNKYYEKTFRGPQSLEFPFSRYTDISPSKLHHYGFSTSFDDIGDPDDLVLQPVAYVDSNKSSSDSNRSQVTIDTGYVSAAESMSAYTTNSSAPRSFRGRFSSEDTQCSLDSFTSTELQRTDTTDSISNTNYNDSPFFELGNPATKKTVFTFDRRFYPKSESDTESPIGPTTPRRLPALPSRKPIPSRITKARTMPPTPPIRSSEATKILQNVQSLSQLQMSDEQTPKKKKNEPIVRQVAHINHQDSIVSSDSFSLTSSPGYTTTTSEMPLLQHGLNMSKTQCPAEIDNLGPMVQLEKVTNSKKRKGNIPPRVNVRQDSNISSDSFSQTSSPGYNSSKLMETPLLASAAKLHNVKPTFKNLEEIEQDTNDNASNDNAITKSATTPASLQTIVRLSNSSNMSHQHRVSFFLVYKLLRPYQILSLVP